MRVRLLATWCVVVGLLGVAGGGCGPSTSGGGGRPFTGGGPTGAPNSAGGAQRDPLGYSFGLAQVSSVSGGTVTALAAVPGTTADSLAAHAPLQQVSPVGHACPELHPGTHSAPAPQMLPGAH